MRVAYGHEILSDDDPYIEIAKNSGHALTHCGPPGNTPIDLFPIRRRFPLPHYHQAHSICSPTLSFVVPRHVFRYQGKGV